jgi:tetratricopeptide (TPR) repeat protein/tRNA A-37 threonylcarbamoyl transferase component Bud32
MSNVDWARIKELFPAAAALPAAARPAFLARHCAASPELWAELESLLTAAESEPDFLAQSVIITALDGAPEALPEGLLLGPWRIGARIGRGGMGEVYMAERADGAFDMRVAVKILKRGVDGAAVRRRFLREQRILGQLSHPNIAHLLDAGAAPDGRPYLVMELVRGLPVNEYCSTSRLPVAAIVQLMRTVCEAVHEAHRSLIVHRDLKPSNVLVTAEGQVKLLDFGIAKLLIEDDPQATQIGRELLPLTPSFAAPEQLRGQPITTAADVYALGVLLYLLLTGRLPHQREGIPASMLALSFKDETIMHPSVAVQSADNALSAPERQQRARDLRGDLGLIVTQALHHEPSRRYRSAQGLADDLQRYLEQRPIDARPDSWAYRTRSFLRRYRVPIAAAVGVFLALAVGLAAALWQAQHAKQERDFALRQAERTEAVRLYLTHLFRSAGSGNNAATPDARAILDRSAKRVLEEYGNQPQVASQVVEMLAELYTSLQDLEGALPLLEGFLKIAGPEADPGSVAIVRYTLASIELRRGHRDRAAELLQQADAFWSRHPDRYREERLQSLLLKGILQRESGDVEGAIAAYRKAITERAALSGHDHRETAFLYNSLAISYKTLHRYAEALEASRESVAIFAAVGEAGTADGLVVLGNFGTAALLMGRLSDAEIPLKHSVERTRELYGESAGLSATLGQYGRLRTIQGRLEEAVPVLREAVAMSVRYAGELSPLAIQSRQYLGEALLASGELRAARHDLEAAQRVASTQLGATHLFTLRADEALARVDVVEGQMARAKMRLDVVAESLRKHGVAGELLLAQTLVTLGDARIAQGLAAEAIAPLREALALRERLLWDQSWEVAQARARLGAALAVSGSAEARPLLERSLIVLKSQLGDDHPLTRQVGTALQ